jgi:hypothetical protein
MTSKNQSRKKKIIGQFKKAIDSDDVRSGKAANIRDYAMFVQAIELEAERKNYYIQ